MDREPHLLHSAATAFGDGRHPTTRGVLEALAFIDPALFTPRTACDMGAGSGILSLAIVARFACPVVAVDIAATAVDAIRANALEMGVGGTIEALAADGFNHPRIAAAAPFDLITMNILAEPLMRLAAPAVAHLAAGGVLIMSGILPGQEDALRDAYQGLGLELSSRLTIDDWVTLVWQKPD